MIISRTFPGTSFAGAGRRASATGIYNKMRSLAFVSILSFFLVNGGVFGCYTSIISFGDSLTDTGNRISYDHQAVCNNYPYGETFFHHPTGRSCDGRLIIDFIAQALGLPFLPPYLQHTNKDFKNGVNFAVGGATAIDATFFWERGSHVGSNYSLGVQLQWFRELLPSLCNSNSNCRNIFRNTLFIVGEIGGNDYNDPLFDGKNIEELRTYVPRVIASISSTISALIHDGAVTLLVPGNLPIGCFASYLTIYHTQNTNDYDPTGCLNWLNGLSEFHNSLLQDELKRLRQLHPEVTIVYADYYNAAMELYRFPTKLGFRREVLTACCGGGGPYNVNESVRCGYEGASSCDDPSLYVSWDGFHLTEAAYKSMATGILDGSFTIPRNGMPCISLNSPTEDLSTSDV